MVESRSEKEPLDRLLLICMYCHKYRNDAGYWELARDVCVSVPDERRSHGICPECLQKNFPDEYSSLCEEGKITVKEKIMPDNRVVFGCFFIVSNKGNIFGDYDKEQRF
jgi:hypothetical protein